MVLEGQKLLLRTSQIHCMIPPPRIRQLSIRTLWPELRQNEEFLRYFPPRAIRGYPSRAYFFGILSTVFEQQYANLLARTTNERRQIAQQQNRIINVTNEMNQIINGIQDLDLMRTSPPSKRILTREPRRAQRQ